jgi:hypothetical protein
VRAATLLLVAALFAALAWSASQPQPQPSAASPPAGRWENAAELHWLTRFGHWQEALYDQRISFGRCRSSFALRVGSPPTSRLAKGFRLARSACNAPDIERGLDTLYGAFELLRPGQPKPLPRGLGIPDVRSASYVDPALTQIATAVAGKPVRALCWSPRDWRSLAAEEGAVFDERIDVTDLGWATVGGSSINLSPGTCETFEEIVSRDDGELRRDPYYWGWAFTTVTHEAEHARGTDNEAQTECFAIQQIADAAFDFGYTRATGQVLAGAVWADYHDELPAYRSDRCRDGGPWDLHPGSSDWP